MPVGGLANGGSHARVSSPPFGCSTLITSAPRSASNMVQYGPARTRVKSTIRMPLRGGGIEGRSSALASDRLAGVVVKPRRWSCTPRIIALAATGFVTAVVSGITARVRRPALALGIHLLVYSHSSDLRPLETTCILKILVRVLARTRKSSLLECPTTYSELTGSSLRSRCLLILCGGR